MEGERDKTVGQSGNRHVTRVSGAAPVRRHVSAFTKFTCPRDVCEASKGITTSVL